MNINPSDMDVRQGYAPAEIAAATAPAAAVLQRNPERDSAPQAEPDLKSKAVAAAADRTLALDTAEKLSKQLGQSSTSLKIRLLNNTQDGVQVEIIDQKSDKVLRKIPQDELIKLSADIKKMTGVFLNHST